MDIIDIKGTSYLLVNKLEEFVDEIYSGEDRQERVVIGSEVGPNFDKYLYLVRVDKKKKDGDKGFIAVEEDPKIKGEEQSYWPTMSIGLKTDKFVISKRLWHSSSEEYLVEIDRKEDKIQITYLGATKGCNHDKVTYSLVHGSPEMER